MTRTVRREPGQTQASADALDAAMAATWVTSNAHVHVAQLNRELRRARTLCRELEAEEARLLAIYEATPYSDQGASAEGGRYEQPIE